jgi:hypothetical protein
MSLQRSLGMAIVWIAFALDAEAQTKQEPRLWKDTPDKAEILSAGFVGAKGNDWLVGGGYQPDGSVVLVGNVLGSILDFGVPERVIGNDAAKPREAEPVAVLDKGKPKVDKQGKPVYEKPSWRHEGATAFILRCGPDLKIRSVHRFPWASASVTAALVEEDGSIYVAGKGSESLALLGVKPGELKLPASERKDGPCKHAFVAKLSPSAEKVEWIREAKGFSDAPQLAFASSGKIRFGAQAYWTLDANGSSSEPIAVSGGPRRTTSISPIDGSIVVGGEHHWRTGREPWRCPTLNIYAPDGTLKHQLYDWGGPYVGLDNLRQVSDTAIRHVTHDAEGNILLYAWSDGGNSVATTQPTDVRSPVGHKGLGITAAGAGVLSAAYVIKIEPKNYGVVSWTIWLAFQGTNKPNSIWIDNLDQSADGSILLAGRSAWGLVQTPNKLSEAEPTGPYVAVLSPDCTTARFSSVVPGAGAVEVSHNQTAWGIIPGRGKHKDKVLFVTGASDEPGAPIKNAAQTKFAGGWTDGYVILAKLPELAQTLKLSVAPPKSVQFEKAAPAKSAKPNLPTSDVVFQFDAKKPSYVTVDLEARDRDGDLWPSFFYGRPIEGTFAWKNGQADAKFVVACNAVCQPFGDQDRRVLGIFVRPPAPKDEAKDIARFRLDSLGSSKTMEAKYDDKGKQKSKTLEFAEGQGTLEIGGKSIAVKPRVTYTFHKNRAGEWESVRVNAWLTLPARELGVSHVPGDRPIDLRISMSAIPKQ